MPEPLWWERARELKAKGLSPAAIGRICGGYERTTVLYATDPEYRERQREKKRARAWERHRRLGNSLRNPHRESVLRAARQEAVETGEHIDAILLRWGAPARNRRGVRA